MPDYRVYLLNAAGHFRERLELTFESDAAAIAASYVRLADEFEIWERARFVFRSRPRAQAGTTELAGSR